MAMKQTGYVALVLAAILGLSPTLLAQRGRPGTPSLPSQSRVPEGRFPGFPPNPGIGQPETPGQPPSVPESDGSQAGLQPNTQAVTASDQLSRTPRLAGRLADMLAVESLTTEPDGFRNLGLFVAAVQVSHNVEGTTFDGLKSRLLGNETTDPMSLGEAIQDETALSEAEATEAADQAAGQAAELIDENS